jgi:bifunctional non-homologous end joining protein LigD
MRDFSRTPEPPPSVVQRGGPLTFTIQKHAARRLHYDFRLEIDGVLVSWPIPKGPSYDLSEKRLAIQTEDHPYEYGTFEGVIPHAEYGGGQVIVWDAGTYTVVVHDVPLDFHDRSRIEKLARDGVERGHLSVFLNGRKLKGGWTLQRTRGKGQKSQWLFLKRRDGLESSTRTIVSEDRSVLSGLSIEDLASGTLPERAASQLAPTAEGVAGAKKAAYPKAYEPKLDGHRALAFVQDGKVHLRSHDGQGYERRYPQVARALAAQPVTTAVFDGEVESVGRYYAFDLLYLDGYDLRSVSLSERKSLLHAVLAPLGGIEEVAA